MKSLFKKSLYLSMVVLVIANIAILVFGISLGDEVNRFEEKIVTLKRENLTLEKEVARLSSLRFAEIQAKNWDFTNLSEPVYLDNLRYAFNR